MLAIALVALHLAIVTSYPPLFNLGHANLEIGLLPSVTTGAVLLLSITRRSDGKDRSFACGFLGTLLLTACVYLVLSLTVPELVKWPIVYYINFIEPNLYDADLSIIYWMSLEIDGLILGAPQLLLASCGGAIVKTVAESRRNPVAPQQLRSFT
jgi:peptidoglycan biosynthesis protein MviN/MurJ (putative lipid II flippase)